MFSHLPRSFALTPFEPLTTDVIRALNVHIWKSDAVTLALRYVLDTDLPRLRVPATRTPRHADELWTHTCFEMFLRKAADTPAYYELNASPSSEWALYSFDGYHQNMAPMNPVQSPRIRVTSDLGHLQLEVHLNLRDIPHAGGMALAAVIEDDDGELSYWALRHISPRPDFHQLDSFITM